MNGSIYAALTLIVPLVLAIVFHEVAHGLVAKLMGDPTAAERRRLSLNPLRHVDPVGTVVVPGALALAHLPVFGWAKPVPVIAARMRNPRLGMMLTAAAGPGMNLLMALLSAVLIGLLVRLQPPPQDPPAVVSFVAANLVNFIQINTFLAIFNLLPLPPFDGSHIVEGLLPRSLALRYARVRKFGFMLMLIVLVVLPTLMPGVDLVGRWIDPPFDALIRLFGQVVSAVAGRQVV